MIHGQLALFHIHLTTFSETLSTFIVHQVEAFKQVHLWNLGTDTKLLLSQQKPVLIADNASGGAHLGRMYFFVLPRCFLVQERLEVPILKISYIEDRLPLKLLTRRKLTPFIRILSAIRCQPPAWDIFRSPLESMRSLHQFPSKDSSLSKPFPEQGPLCRIPCILSRHGQWDVHSNLRRGGEMCDKPAKTPNRRDDGAEYPGQSR